MRQLERQIAYRLGGLWLLTFWSSLFNAEENFAGARNILAEDSFMTKRAFPGVIGFLGLCLTLFAQTSHAQQTRAFTFDQLCRSGVVDSGSAASRPDFLSRLNSSAWVRSVAAPALLEGGYFSFSSALTWTQPTSPNFLPGLPTMAPQRAVATSSAVAARDSSKEVVDVQRSNLFDYAGGEVGFLYGRSTGKFGGETKQAYIIGEVGDDKFHISAGAAYEESSWRVPRSGW